MRLASATRWARKRQAVLHERLRQWPVPGTHPQSRAQRVASASATNSAIGKGSGATASAKSDTLRSQCSRVPASLAPWHTGIALSQDPRSSTHSQIAVVIVERAVKFHGITQKFSQIYG